MAIKVIDEQEFQELHNSLNEIKSILTEIKKSNDPLGDRLLHIDEVAKMLNITKRAIYTLRQEGKLTYIQQPGSSRIYFRASAVNEYLNKYQHNAFKK